MSYKLIDVTCQFTNTSHIHMVWKHDTIQALIVSKTESNF